MSNNDLDWTAWADARQEGKRRFVETTITFGAKVGVCLAAWNAAVGGTFGNNDVHRIVLEGTYYLLGSVALAALSATLEWKYLEAKFGR